MSDNLNLGDEPLVPREAAPDHSPDFWAQLDSSIAADSTTATPRVDQTAQMGRIEVGAWTPRPTTVVPISPARRMWPMAAAAALLVIVGLGFVVTRMGNDPSTSSEVVSGELTQSSGDGSTPTVDVNPLDGPTDEDDTSQSDADEVAGEPTPTGDDPATTAVTVPTVEPAPGAAGDLDPDPVADDGSPEATGAGTDSTNVLPVATPVPAIPDFERAPGAIGDQDHLPLDQGLPTDATFLGTWEQRQLSWYGVTDNDTTCANGQFSEIRLVNDSGITQPTRDPQLQFSGDISHFAVRSDEDQAAWVSSCGTQLELYVATLEPTGQIADLDLVWLGEGSVPGALVLWDGSEVNLNAIEPGGQAFSVAYNVESKLLSRNGGPSRIMIEAGAPAERSLTPLAATPDGGLTYWDGKAPAGTISACPELFGSGVSDTLWLRQGEGQWQPAVADEFPLGTVTAAAIEPGSGQIAFADVCGDEPGRVLVGSQLQDGRITDIHEIDLSPYVPGFAAQLHWVDAQTVRIETDNTEFGVDPVRYDFRFPEGTETGIIFQLPR